MTILKDVLKEELSKAKYKDMTLSQVVTYLNAREQSFQIVVMPKGKRFSVEPTLLLNMSGIDPETVNKLINHKKTKKHIETFLSKPIKCEEFSYWRGIIDWLATTKTSWYRKKKLLSMEQCEALKKTFDDIVGQSGGKIVKKSHGPILIAKLTDGKTTAVRIEDIKDIPIGTGKD